jgi:sec-independent protein translocase protein TatA
LLNIKFYKSKNTIFVALKSKNMFGIGGGELVFIMFIVLMLFGSDKIPEIARTMGKAMAQLKHATNDIKNEIQKGAESSGMDTKSLTDFSSKVTSEITKAKDNLLSETTKTISDTKQEIEDSLGPIKRQK